MKIDAIVLAGSTNEGRLRQCSPVENEALIPIGNRIMLDYVVAALLSAQEIEQIAIVGPKNQLEALYASNSRIILVDSGETVIDSFIAGVKVLAPQGHILIATGDIPLLSAEAVEAFLARCTDKEVDLYYPVVSKEANERLYPAVKRTYLHLKDGIYTGGNIFLFNPFKLDSCIDKGRELVSLRKSPLALSKLIGLIFIIKYLTRQLSLQEIERQFSRLLGLKGKAVILDYPEIGIDVDKPSDLELVRRVLA